MACAAAAWCFTQKHNGQPAFGQRFQLNIEDFPHAWFMHPDPQVDLAIIPMRPLEQAARDQGVELYYHVIDSRLAPDAATTRALDALEEILFVGYPSGVWDQVNLMPILRRGTTATPMALDFEGRAEFLIDAAVYPGSSGSPVFVYQPDTLRPSQSAGKKFCSPAWWRRCFSARKPTIWCRAGAGQQPRHGDGLGNDRSRPGDQVAGRARSDQRLSRQVAGIADSRRPPGFIVLPMDGSRMKDNSMIYCGFNQ
jgi:hypothetical protein